MSHDRLLEIIKCLRFDLKSKRRLNLLQYKFCLGTSLWNSLTKNCQKAYIPDTNITINEQLLPCKSSQQIYSVQGKQTRQAWFEILDGCGCRNKVLLRWISYLKKDESRLDGVSVPTSVVMKLMSPLFGRGYKVICENYFTSLDLLLRLAQKRCSIVGTVCRNRREVPEVLKTTRPLHENNTARNYSFEINQVNCCEFNDIPVQEV